jgi:hypothetical protein
MRGPLPLWEKNQGLDPDPGLCLGPDPDHGLDQGIDPGPKVVADQGPEVMEGLMLLTLEIHFM